MPEPQAAQFERLSRAERLQLLRFVTSFVWADLSVNDDERALVTRLVLRLKLDPEEARQVEDWLRVPPLPDSVDPAAVPPAHRQLVLDAVRAVVEADGKVSPEERTNLRLLEQLLR